MATLSANDSRVLSALFDPESSPSPALALNPSNVLPGLSEAQCASLQRATTAALAPLDVPSPSPSTISQVHAALSALLQAHPAWAPAYVDRAQVARLSLPPAELFSTLAPAPACAALLADLGAAIALATPRAPADPVSALQRRVLAAAHTHRGLLLLRVAELRAAGREVHGVEDSRLATQQEPQDIEAAASRDFFLGGRYGNELARGLAVKTNPYAKMCGAIVKEAITKEIEEAEGLLREFRGGV